MGRILGVLSCIILLAACHPKANINHSLAIEGSSSTKGLPALSIKDANGKVINLASLKGKKVFVNLWATWCPPCVAEIPSIQKLYAKSVGKNAVFVLLSMDDEYKTPFDWMKKKGYKLPVYFPTEDLPALFQVEGIPATFIFDTDGTIIYQEIGMADYNTKKFEKLMGL